MVAVKQTIAVIGAGSWGTALALLLAGNGYPVQLWGHEADLMQRMQSTRINDVYMPNIIIPDNVNICVDFESALNNAQTILIVVPSHAFRGILTKLSKILATDYRLVWATKGLDPDTDQLLCDVAAEVLGNNIPLASLSGPSFAKEVAKALPTAVTVAATDAAFEKDLVEYFHNDWFRVYRSDDIKGVCLCGAIKNVLAIATGLSDGLQYGANARAALITRGLAEMMRLGEALGASSETFVGLAGLGDLVLTCTDNQSRNRRFGILLGQGESVVKARQQINQVVEGAQNANQVHRLSQRYQVEMPICHTVYRILQVEVTAVQAVKELMSREPGKAG